MIVNFPGKRPPSETSPPASAISQQNPSVAKNLGTDRSADHDDTRPAILIANRGEIALRIASAASSLNLRTVSVFSPDDSTSLHTRKTDAAIVKAAKSVNAVAVHPGYGFLSESAELERRCKEEGVIFVGPRPEVFEVFGDKAKARELAMKCCVPTVPGTQRATTLDEAAWFAKGVFGSKEFKQGVYGGIIVKALFGGGGRGMRIVTTPDALADAYARCKSEAKAAFGRDEVYVEALLAKARHIEVQIIAPAPYLHPALSDALGKASVNMAMEVGYEGLGTWEFLVVGGEREDGKWFFIEANPRVQVEHTATEEILDVDLVSTQLHFALNPPTALRDTVLGFGRQEDVPRPAGWAVQLRVNMEKVEMVQGTLLWVSTAGGVLASFEPPSGRGTRVDHTGYSGYRTNPNFDPLLAKVILSSPRSLLSDVFRGCTTVRFLRAVLTDPAVVEMGDRSGKAVGIHTRLIDDELDRLCKKAGWDGSTTAVAVSKPLFFSTTVARSVQGPPGTDPVVAPMQSTIVSIDVKVGDMVKKGQQVAVLNAMKMEHVAFAEVAGIVRNRRTRSGSHPSDLAETIRRHYNTMDEGRPDAVARRRKLNKRTARENIADLCDPGSFMECGGLVIAAQKARRSMEELQTDAGGWNGYVSTSVSWMIAIFSGIGHVNGKHFEETRSRVMVFAYDYTVLAGTQGVFNHKKKDRMFQLAWEYPLPVVFYCEGGGGRPGDIESLSNSGGLDILTFRHFGRLSGLVPMIGITTGYCFPGNTALLGTCDVIIATEGSKIGMGGPAMIEGGGLGVFKPTEVGPVEVQNFNGYVLVKDGTEATATAKKYLSYFQGPLREWRCADQRLLRSDIPENRLRTSFDEGSILELRPQWAVGMVTAFARIEGRAVGLLANNCTHLGGAIDADGGDKAARFMQLCDAYDIPIVSLCGTHGFMVGPEIPLGSFFTIVLRKGYGLGAQAMCGGSFHGPLFTGRGMGLEGAVRLAYRNELAAIKDPQERLAAENAALAQLYESGKSLRAAESLNIDNVIDPAVSRKWIMSGLKAGVNGKGYVPGQAKRRPCVDTW
ncbi:ClpP/crotonase [Gonapodya prolifera JEL478]|uniref:ClpP/crotonase n=1 Tax=Gonapodya prolifera (strain JEL478) TaxID=1344416 RepID=A0A139A8Z0_GONPJ|nr:ClpP/crotonase [Gonapodya prolifera JEL478]|eukprot:KXS13174.1 ClpP/crotonase [Gonapodya prolifera JEL478]